MTITVIGSDIAKEVFQIHDVDAHGKIRLRKQLCRYQMAQFFADLDPWSIGIEPCGRTHYWARLLSQFGYTVKLMAPQFVKPYVKSNKNDSADAEAISKAVGI